MDPRFRRQMIVTQGAIVLSAATAIIALSFTNRTRATIRQLGDDIAAVDGNTLWLSLPTEPCLLRDPSSGKTPRASVAS